MVKDLVEVCEIEPTNKVVMLTDGGPGKGEVDTLDYCADNGPELFPGFPNGTGYNQICDQIFGPLKKYCEHTCDKEHSLRIEAAKLPEAPAPRPLDRNDAGLILAGHDDDQPGPMLKGFSNGQIFSTMNKVCALLTPRFHYLRL